MKSSLMLLMFALTLSSCVVANRRGGGVAVVGPSVEVVPILPMVVEIESDYYVHGGYHYFYTGDSWYYSNSYGGSRSALPRSHWPKETRRGRGRGRGNGKH